MCMECKGKGWAEYDDGCGDGNTHAEPCRTCEFYNAIAEQEAKEQADWFDSIEDTWILSHNKMWVVSL